MRPMGTAADLQERRIKVVKWITDGTVSKKEAAKRANVSIRAIDKWLEKYKDRGITGLAPIPAKPPNRKLTDKQILLKGAVHSGFEEDLWNCPRIAAVIKKKLSVSYHPQHIGRLLRRMGWTLQRPAKKAQGRSASDIEKWTKVEWKKIKKSQEE